MADQKKSSDNEVQGEGDYKAARRYRQEVEDFTQRKSNEITDMAKDAEQAIDGPEGENLKRAEEKGKSKARG